MSLSGLTSAPDPLRADPCPDHQPILFCTFSPLPTLTQTHDTSIPSTNFPGSLLLVHPSVRNSLLLPHDLESSCSALRSWFRCSLIQEVFPHPRTELHALPHCLQCFLHAFITSLGPWQRNCPLSCLRHLLEGSWLRTGTLSSSPLSYLFSGFTEKLLKCQALF